MCHYVWSRWCGIYMYIPCVSFTVFPCRPSYPTALFFTGITGLCVVPVYFPIGHECVSLFIKWRIIGNLDCLVKATSNRNLSNRPNHFEVFFKVVEPCIDLQNDWTTEEIAINRWDFATIEFKTYFGRFPLYEHPARVFRLTNEFQK